MLNTLQMQTGGGSSNITVPMTTQFDDDILNNFTSFDISQVNFDQLDWNSLNQLPSDYLNCNGPGFDFDWQDWLV